jgi:hypothetical protein
MQRDEIDPWLLLLPQEHRLDLQGVQLDPKMQQDGVDLELLLSSRRLTQKPICRSGRCEHFAEHWLVEVFGFLAQIHLRLRAG